MITIEMSGGLGNQMFQYALALKLKKLNKKVQMVHSYEDDSLRDFELGCFEGIEDGEIPIIPDSQNQLGVVETIKRRIRGSSSVYDDKIIIFQPEIYKLDHVRLRGYWQNEKFFSDIVEDVFTAFTFKKSLVDKWHYDRERYIQDDYQRTAGKQVISVHVRRTDYNSSQNERLYAGICTVKYYMKAIRYMQERINDTLYLFFSDDTEWVVNELMPLLLENEIFDYRVVEDESVDSARDMWMMTRCDHHIIANSTYSWWGAWLGINPQRIVVAPNKWMNNHSDDIICSNWTRVGS